MKVTFQVGSEEREVTVEQADPTDPNLWRVRLGNGVERVVDARRMAGGSLSLLLDGQIVWADVDTSKDGGEVTVETRAGGVALKIADPKKKILAQVQGKRSAEAAGPLAIRAPMPGKIVKVLVKAGEAVTAGQPVVVVEAMKMENEVRATRDGSVQTVHVTEGQPIDGNAPLVTLV
jgi:biotin carboxyl carrier protein